MKIITSLFTAAFAWLLPHVASAQVVINEIGYDDGGTDDREFVELYNSGAGVVDIAGWTIRGYDVTTTNPSTTLPAGAVIQPGGFYVAGNAGVLNASHTLAANFLENDNEAVVLRDNGGVVVDAIAYETNKGIAFITTGTTAPADSADILAQIGPGFFGNHQCSDLPGTPLVPSSSVGRFVDGRDTNNNGRDFGMRQATPGTSNTSPGLISAYQLENPEPLAPGTASPSMAFSFVPPRVIDPATVDTNNLNAITPPYGPGSKSWVCFDPTGGGNGAASSGTFPAAAASFSIRAYLETADMPIQFNAANVQFRGSEITMYGIGNGDALANLTDVDGSVGLSPLALPAAESGNGLTGIAWLYERVAEDPTTHVVSEKLHLVDANDGGDSDLGGNTPLDWTILATYDLGSTAPGWHSLSISIDAAGNGSASYDGQTTAFTVTGMNGSAFNVSYRENLQQGADGTPDAFMRPATFTSVPELGQLAFAPPTAGSINLTIPAAAGQTIGVEFSTSLGSGSWSDLGDFSIIGSTGTFSDVNPGRVSGARGFYRAFLR